MTEFTEWLNNPNNQPDYKGIVEFAPDILQALEEYKGKVIAQKLNIPAPILSSIKPILQVLADSRK